MINRMAEALIKVVIKANLSQGNNLAGVYSTDWLEKARKFDAKPDFDPEFEMQQPAPPPTTTNMVAMVIRPGEKKKRPLSWTLQT